MQKTTVGLVLAGLLLSPPVDAEAQWIRVGAAAGASVPISDLSESHEPGYNVELHVAVGIPRIPVALRFEGFYNDFGSKAVGLVGGGDMQIRGFSANVVYDVRLGGIRAYVIGGAGSYQIKYETVSPIDLGYNAGAGTRFRVAGRSIFIETRLHAMQDERRFRFIPVTLGLEF